MNTIAVVDCGVGNLHSVVSGIKRAQPTAVCTVSDQAEVIAAADKVIFPGDGNFGACMREIKARGLHEALCAAAQEKPFFGICAGMQVLFSGSEESEEPGLGIFAAQVKRFPQRECGKIPHMGWNIGHKRRAHAVMEGIEEEAFFYFIHSYYVPQGEWTLLTAEYGVGFSAAIAAGQLVATQFHPEKSGAQGIRLLENFLR